MLEDEILEEIKKNEELGRQNEIIEIDENEEINNTQYDLSEINQEPKKKKKTKKPSKWSKISKKNKIIIITCSIAVLLIIVMIFVYFLVVKKDKDLPIKKEPIVIIEKDNYRYEDGNLIFTDKNKKDLGRYVCANKDEDLCYVANYSNEDDFDIDKKVLENGVSIDNRSDIIEDNYVFVYDNTAKENGEVLLYDIKKEEVVETYSLVKEVSSNMVIIKDTTTDNYGVIDFSNQKITELIKPTYDYIGYILESDAFVVADNKNYQLLDLDGKTKSKSVPGEIKSFDVQNISVEIDKKYYIYDYNGNKRIEKDYDYIRFVSNYAIAAKSKKLFVYDKDGNPMNMDGIRISSSSYNTKLIFNDDLRQVGKEVAFDVSVSNDNLRIEYDDTYQNINLNEGKFNSSLEYISYFQGKLYIYGDADKTDLLGSYPCNYANSINSSTTSLDNCFIAKESNILKSNEEVDNGYIPVYNKRYIFIADTKNPNTNDNIIFWDLKNNEKLATYKEVDVGYHSTDNIVNFVDTAGTITLAKNTSDSYGLINIGSSSVDSLIRFKDADNNSTNVSVSVLKGNLLFKRSDGTYHLYDTKGNELTKNLTTTSEIVDFNANYIKVKGSENVYLIYSIKGSIVSNEFKHILMENNYYIAVDSENTLGVYKYDSKTNLMPDEIKIDGKDFNNEIKYNLNGNKLTIKYVSNGTASNVEVNIG